ncbi:hypothetical protein CDAR_399451 [Caerostris darwini]|uniref:Uncharacterized protein n=1 Tax=Caerostris darwini TaxID=1538125 RepID=A0AAV4SYU3_9ARAC|nr:hypothetical protein CDAR_399451 [Caerostris darwini]
MFGSTCPAGKCASSPFQRRIFLNVCHSNQIWKPPRQHSCYLSAIAPIPYQISSHAFYSFPYLPFNCALSLLKWEPVLLFTELEMVCD